MRIFPYGISKVAIALSMVWLVLPAACTTDEYSSAPSNGGPYTQPTPTNPGSPLDKADLTPTEQQFQTEMAAQYAVAETLKSAELESLYPPTSTASGVSYDPTSAAHFSLIESALSLTEDEVDFIADHGFGVVPRHEYFTAHDAYYAIYVKDLPVYITADSVLFSLHRSFGTALKSLEQGELYAKIDEFLSRTHTALAALKVEPELLEAQKDMDAYLAIARSLLAGNQIDPLISDSSLVEELLDSVEAEAMRDVVLFGSKRRLDFSQFTPRGHYTENEALTQYFQSMMWLGRVDLRFREYNSEAEQWVWNDRQIQAGWLLHRAVQQAQTFKAWHAVHSVIGALVGEVDAMDLNRFEEFVGASGATGDASFIGDLSKVHETLVKGGYGRQRIRSHYLSTGRLDGEVTPLTMSFAVLGQRFTPDSYVFSKVVHDDVANRRLPSPFDMLFALGNNDALSELTAEIQGYDEGESNAYAQNLHMLRWILDGYTDEFWESSVYYTWIHALSALNTMPDEAPEVVHTERFRKRLHNTQLASWAELRHDTLLYAKQSYTGSAGCDYPAAYVEPVPEFWARMEAVGLRLNSAISNANLDSYTASWVSKWATDWARVTGTLRSISEKQLAEEPLSEAEQTLLDTWISIPDDTVCGGPAFNGVFTTLLLNIDELNDPKYTIADVHTNPGGATTDPAAVLHVGTGPHQLMVFTRDSCEGVQSYVGVVSSFYAHEEPGVVRLTNEEWREKLRSDEPPARPAFASQFMTP